MKRQIAAAFGLAVIGFAASAHAADYATPVPANAWGGLYFGAEAAYSLSNTQLQVPGLVDWDGRGARGWSGGAFLGFDHEFAGGWVAGVEFGGDWNDISGTNSLTVGDGLGGYEFKGSTTISTDWSASISGRIGYLVNPQTLFFASLGATAAHGIGSYELGIDNVTVESASDQDMFYGLAFAGVGAETILGNHWRGRFEYVTSFLNTNTYDVGVPLEVTPIVGTAKAALIYDFGNTGTSSRPAGYAPPSWTGLYAGVDAGQSMGVGKYDLSIEDSNFTYDGFGSDGWSGGAMVGFNLQVGSRFVVGLEAGATASTLASEYTFSEGSPLLSVKGENTAWYDARVRAGFLASPGTLIYGFAGVGRVNGDLTVTDYTGLLGGGTQSQSYDRDLVEFGGGIEAWVTRGLSLRAEYAYAMLDSVNAIPGESETGKFDMDQATATVAAIYHFGK